MSLPSTYAATDGDAYHAVMGRWSNLLAVPFLDFVGVANGERLLDVGCGTGDLMADIAKKCPATRSSGIDPSSAYIDYAKQRNNDPHLTFEVGDACALPYPNSSFDRALALLVLHFIPNTSQAIAEMKRVVRPGAVVGAAVWDVRGGFVSNRIFYDTAAALSAKGNERRASNYNRPMTKPGELDAAWKAAGFSDVVETSLMIRMEFASFEDYWSPYVGKDGPHAEYVWSLTDAERSRLRDAVYAAYLGGGPDGVRSYAGIALAVRGMAPAG